MASFEEAHLVSTLRGDQTKPTVKTCKLGTNACLGEASCEHKSILCSIYRCVVFGDRNGGLLFGFPRKTNQKGVPLKKKDTHGHLFGTHSPWSELCLAPLRLDLCPPTRQQKVYKLWAVLTFPARSLTFGSILETTTKQMKQAKLRNRMAGANKNSITTTSMVKPKSQLGVQELLAHLPRHSIPERKKKAKTETTVLFLFLYTHTKKNTSLAHVALESHSEISEPSAAQTWQVFSGWPSNHR